MRPELTEHYIFKDSRTIVLERGFEWDSASDRNPLEWERVTAHCAVRALTSLCEGLIRPMTFGVTRQWVDEEFGVPLGGAGKPPRWNWFLKTPQTPPDAESAYVDEQVMETATLDERTTDEIIKLTISVNWSFWWNPGAGRAMLDEAVNRLIRQGWRDA
ncbi:hypothetical protein [Streptomyces sp. 4N124]|uniref:hypothetical protein n=1 Tax=Streptomyces sp. 4N124 TaxID=3457420 RepID=UPI003FD386F9